MHSDNNSTGQEDSDTWKRSRQGVGDSDQLERKRRNAVLNALEDHPNGLGFNELHDCVDELFARNTLRNRLERYEDNGLVEMSGARRGQKKTIQLSDAGTKPEAINNTYKNQISTVLNIWSEALNMYEPEDFHRERILKYVYDECLRYDLVNRVTASSGTDSFSVDMKNIELQSEAIPAPESESPEEFFNQLAGELQKYYTERIFGRVFIETEDKADQLKSDVMLEAYSTTNELRAKMLDVWKESDAPCPYSE